MDTPWIAVDSSCLSRIRRVGQDVECTLLLSGKTYRYLGVPESVWTAFQGAESKGTFYNHVIKNYPFVGPI